MATATTYGQFSGVGASGDANIDPLVYGSKWGGGTGTGVTVDYSFSTYGSWWTTNNNYLYEEPWSLSPMNSTQQATFRVLMGYYADVANISFNEVTENNTESGEFSPVGDIRIAFTDDLVGTGFSGWAYYPQGHPNGGDVWIHPSETLTERGSFSAHTYAHELGHAIGMSHPFDGGSVNNSTLSGIYDTSKYTIMSYDQYSQYGNFNPYTPQLYDIMALQYIYGANMTTRTGNSTYSFYNTKMTVKCIWDAGGNDTISAENQNVYAVIRLGEGEFSSIGVKTNGTSNAYHNISIAFGAVIENATGSRYNDGLYGNAVANKLLGKGGNDTLYGYGGNDTLNGGTGNDTMQGGTGNDHYYVDAVTDTVIEVANAGTDKVYSNVTYTLGANVEKLVLQGGANLNGTGNGQNNVLNGNTGANVLKGGNGNDTLNGGGGNDSLKGNAGNDILNGGGGVDTMQGGTGNDHYYVDAVTDTVIEVANAGTDKVYSNVTYTLGANVEKLVLQGGANLNGTGNGQNNVINGNTGANVLKGGNGNDTLNGGGGNDSLKGNAGNDTLYGNGGHDILNGGGGVDTMYGGGDNDTYYVDATTDTVIENAAAGTDKVYSNVTYTLGANVEKLVLQGGANLNGTGNGQNNVINGNTGANVLKGGNGNDALNGGAGNDSLKGNGGNDTLRGNGGNDILNGGGGVDTMYGGGGNDTYYVNATTDTAIEVANAGADKVYSTVTYALGANVEKLVLQGGANLSGTGNGGNNVINGNRGDNVLKGGNGNDTLNGGGGNDTLKGNGGTDTLSGNAGGDTLIGGGGADVFRYTSTTNAGVGAGETIVDFDATNDAEDISLLGLLTGTFDWLGAHTNTFTGATGGNNTEARFNDTSKLLEIDTNGDGVVDMNITLTGVSLAQLGVNDFWWT